jgi:hypothetical protein
MFHGIRLDDDGSSATGETRVIHCGAELRVRVVAPRWTDCWRGYKLDGDVEMGVSHQVRIGAWHVSFEELTGIQYPDSGAGACSPRPRHTAELSASGEG